MKKCRKCGINKEFDGFYKHSQTQDGRLNICIQCISVSNYNRRLASPEVVRNSQRKWRSENKDRRTETEHEWRNNNAERVKFLSATYYRNNREKCIAAASKNNLKRRRACIKFRLSNILRSRLNKAIKGGYKAGSAVTDLGCSIPELKLYLESKFQEGMTWDNYGHKTWHIDHILPLSKFDLSNREELLRACNYTNLQPLWAKDNLVKSNKYTPNDEA